MAPPPTSPRTPAATRLRSADERLRPARPLVTPPAAVLILAAATWLTFAGPQVPFAAAGQYHNSATLRCNDCHTQHDSESGAPVRTDSSPSPAYKLLRRSTIVELCLSCHDGNSSAPDVIDPPYVSAGGTLLRPESGTSVMHHDLNYTGVPPGGTATVTLVCTTCHDPHGNDNYRNLRPDPTATAQPPVTVLALQTKVPGAEPQNPVNEVYAPSNVVYRSGVSAWCITCHGAPVEGSDHPDEKTIFGALKASYTAWTSVTLPRVPVHSPVDTNIPSTDDRVICISCHKAHGSSNYKTLIYADGLTLDSTCQECHNQ